MLLDLTVLVLSCELSILVFFASCAGAVDWICFVCGMGVLGWRVSGGGICGLSSVLLLRSNRRADMLGISMSPASSSTLMHLLLRFRVRRQIKCIERILYYAT